MVCPDKKPKGKLHVYFNGKVQTDEDVRYLNLLHARWLLTPRKVSFTAILFTRLAMIRGFYAVRPLRGEGKLPAVPAGKTK